MRLKGIIGLRVANTHRERRKRWTEVNMVYNTITRTSLSIVRSLRDRKVACSASDLESLNFESCVWRAVSSHHLQEVLLAQFSLYVHNSGLKPDSFHFTRTSIYNYSTNTNIIFERQLGGHHLISRRRGRDIGMDQNIFFNRIQLMIIFFQLYG